MCCVYAGWMRSALATRFGRFLLVGGFGFVVEAVALFSLCNIAGFSPYSGRAISFSVAVVTTWLLNRTFTFRVGKNSVGRLEFTRYVMVNGLGLALNVAVYVIAISASGWMSRYPSLALIPASLAGLTVNYLGAVRFAFRQRR